MHSRVRSAGIWAAGALLLVLIAAMAIIVWRPWDPVPTELRGAFRDASRLPGVAEIDVQRRETAYGRGEPFVQEPSEFAVSVRLDSGLTPDDATAAAKRVYELLVPAAEAYPPDSMLVFMRVIAGEPEDVNGVLVDPLEVPYSLASGVEDVADAFTIWQAGARQVSLYGIAPPVGHAGMDAEPGIPPGSPAGIGIEAAAAPDLASLADLAAGLRRPADLYVSDRSVDYSGYGSVPDVDAVRLAVAAASRPGVEHTRFSNSVAPQLSIHTTLPAGSPEHQQLQQWLEAHTYATNAGHPVAFVISEPGYNTLTDGWVSAFAPPEPEPRILPLPSDVKPWSDDEDAPDCTGADVHLSYGGSEAATGARYAFLGARNVSERPCAVEGVPEVVFRTADGVAQADVQIEPYAGGVIPARVVVPPGEQLVAPFTWRAASTANNPNVTTSIEVTAVPGAPPVLLYVTPYDRSPSSLDIMDGAEVRFGPWVQAFSGW